MLSTERETNMEENLLGKNIKYLREIYGETLEELGKSIFLTKSAIKGYEDGRRKPDFEKLVAIAKHYQKTADELLHTDLAKLEEIDINNKTIYDVVEIYKQMFPLFSSDEIMKNDKFRDAYQGCLKIEESLLKSENWNWHRLEEYLNNFLHIAEETNVPEAQANIMWIIFLLWQQINDTEKMFELGKQILNYPIDEKNLRIKLKK